jgi:tRNA threonylcarbamoyladenosine biosynthesis protein TsaE
MTSLKTVTNSEWISQGPDETFALGKQLAQQLTGGEILMLDGALGAGKTVFVKGLASGLSIDPAEVTSPSFTLVNPHQGRLLLYHLDLYRLPEGQAAAAAVDLDEILSDSTSVIVIEWAERLGSYPLPDDVIHIRITGDGEDARTITLRQNRADDLMN